MYVNNSLSSWEKTCSSTASLNRGPVLFYISLNEIFPFITSFHLTNYVDDGTLYCSWERFINKKTKNTIRFLILYGKLYNSKCWSLIMFPCINKADTQYNLNNKKQGTILDSVKDKKLTFYNLITVIYKKAFQKLSTWIAVNKTKLSLWFKPNSIKVLCSTQEYPTIM